MRTAALIIARLQSKRLPRKNLLDIAGKPVFVWNLEKALRIFTAVYFSSDSEEMLKIAAGKGAIAIRRPADLAADNVPNIPVFQHAFEQMDSPDMIVSLQANSPTLPEKLIGQALKIMKTAGIQELVTIDKNLKVHGSIWAIKRERLLNYGDPYEYKAEVFLRDDSTDIHTAEDFAKAETELRNQS